MAQEKDISYSFAITEQTSTNATILIKPTSMVDPWSLYYSIMRDNFLMYRLSSKLSSSIVNKKARIYISPDAYMLRLDVKLDDRIFDSVEKYTEINSYPDGLFMHNITRDDKIVGNEVTQVSIIPDEAYTDIFLIAKTRLNLYNDDDLNDNVVVGALRSVENHAKKILVNLHDGVVGVEAIYSQNVEDRRNMRINSIYRLTHIMGNRLLSLTRDGFTIIDDNDSEEITKKTLASIIGVLPMVFSSSGMLRVPISQKYTIREYDENKYEYHTSVSYDILSIDLLDYRRPPHESAVLKTVLIYEDDTFTIRKIKSVLARVRFIVIQKGDPGKISNLSRAIRKCFHGHPILRHRLNGLQIVRIITSENENIYALQKP